MAFAALNRTGLNALNIEISATVYRGLQRIEEYRAYRRTVAELSRLDARQLADLGLHRSGIRSVARETIYGA